MSGEALGDVKVEIIVSPDQRLQAAQTVAELVLTDPFVSCVGNGSPSLEVSKKWLNVALSCKA